MWPTQPTQWHQRACPRCSTVLKTLVAYDDHVRDCRHSPQLVYPCGVCRYGFSNSAAVKRHHRDFHFPCVLESCEAVYAGSDALLKHYEESHLYCEECRRPFESEANLDAHLRSTHHVGLTISCVCKSKFPTVAAVFQHVERGGCASVNPHLFYHILLIMQDRGAFRTLFTDTANALDKWIADYGLSSTLKEGSGGSRYKCASCRREFERYAAFAGHFYKEGDGLEGGTFMCWLCKRPFDTPGALAQHRESGYCAGN